MSFEKIYNSVGMRPLGNNRPEDVIVVQTLLNKAGLYLKIDGKCGPETVAAIKRYQTSQGLIDDGLVMNHSLTMDALRQGQRFSFSSRPRPTLTSENLFSRNIRPSGLMTMEEMRQKCRKDSPFDSSLALAEKPAPRLNEIQRPRDLNANINQPTARNPASAISSTTSRFSNEEEFKNKLIERMKIGEGSVNFMYKDSLSFVTIGIGILLAKAKDNPKADLTLLRGISFHFVCSEKIGEITYLKDDAIVHPAEGVHDIVLKEYDRIKSKPQWALPKLYITNDEIIRLFMIHYDKATKDLKEIFGEERFMLFSDNVKFAIYDMIYNLGKGGFQKFPNLIRNIKNQDWRMAIENCLRYQTPSLELNDSAKNAYNKIMLQNVQMKILEIDAEKLNRRRVPSLNEEEKENIEAEIRSNNQKREIINIDIASNNTERWKTVWQGIKTDLKNAIKLLYENEKRQLQVLEDASQWEKAVRMFLVQSEESGKNEIKTIKTIEKLTYKERLKKRNDYTCNLFENEARFKEGLPEKNISLDPPCTKIAQCNNGVVEIVTL